MLQLVVSDSSCLIDLRKGGLLFTALLLPYRFVVVLPLVESELHGFTKADWEELKVRGLNVVDLGERQQPVQALKLTQEDAIVMVDENVGGSNATVSTTMGV